jgi:hypothetical protein
MSRQDPETLSSYGACVGDDKRLDFVTHGPLLAMMWAKRKGRQRQVGFGRGVTGQDDRCGSLR